jgi:hypothetical protein
MGRSPAFHTRGMKRSLHFGCIRCERTEAPITCGQEPLSPVSPIVRYRTAERSTVAMTGNSYGNPAMPLSAPAPARPHRHASSQPARPEPTPPAFSAVHALRPRRTGLGCAVSPPTSLSRPFAHVWACTSVPCFTRRRRTTALALHAQSHRASAVTLRVASVDPLPHVSAPAQALSPARPEPAPPALCGGAEWHFDVERTGLGHALVLPTAVSGPSAQP